MRNIIKICVPDGIRSPVLSCEPIMLGYAGENGVTQVDLDFSKWAERFGAGSVALEIMRSGDTMPYLADITVEGTTASWVVSNLDTGVSGVGTAGYTYTVGGELKRSAVFTFYVDRNVGGQPGDRPEPYESLIERMARILAASEAAASDAQGSAEAAETAASHYPKIENGRWYVFDFDAGDYADTGISAEGVSPVVSVAAIAGGHRVTITDAAGEHVFDVMDGSGGSAEPEPSDNPLAVKAEDGPTFYIPSGEGSAGDIVILDGEGGAWHVESGAGTVFDVGVTDGDGGEWHIGIQLIGDLEEAEVFYGLLPPGGTNGQYLVKDSTAEGGARWADLPAYSGVWSVTPLINTQTTLETAQTYLDRDIVVEAIPYAEVSNISGGMTATIGG